MKFMFQPSGTAQSEARASSSLSNKLNATSEPYRGSWLLAASAVVAMLCQKTRSARSASPFNFAAALSPALPLPRVQRECCFGIAASSARTLNCLRDNARDSSLMSLYSPWEPSTLCAFGDGRRAASMMLSNPCLAMRFLAG